MIFYLKYFLYLYGESWHHNHKRSFSISGLAHISLVYCLAGTQKKAGRMFNVLEVVRFPNDHCTTGNENTSGIVALSALYIYIIFIYLSGLLTSSALADLRLELKQKKAVMVFALYTNPTYINFALLFDSVFNLRNLNLMSIYMNFTRQCALRYI